MLQPWNTLLNFNRLWSTHGEMISRAIRLLSSLLKKIRQERYGSILHAKELENTCARPTHSSDLQRPLLKRIDEFKWKSNVSMILTDIIYAYRGRNAARSGAKPQRGRASFSSIGSGSKSVTGAKKIMSYVITDGNWVIGSELNPTDTMSTIATTLKAQGLLGKIVGIQLIRAEEHKGTIVRLRKLKKGDFSDRIAIDTHPLEGNVFRLLLVPISDIWDDDDDDDEL